MTARWLIAPWNSRIAKLHEFGRAEEGAALTEFGLISPVLFLLLFGAFDLGHTLYMKTVLEGAVQKAARDASLQTAAGNDPSVRSAIDNAVESQLRPLNGSATITFNRRFYRTFTEAEAAEAEEFTDAASGTFANGRCDNGELFIDRNNNGVWDGDGGNSVDRAGARDNIVYTVTIEYPRLFPLHSFIDVPDTMNLAASTVLANQPYGDQDTDGAPTERNCP